MKRSIFLATAASWAFANASDCTPEPPYTKNGLQWSESLRMNQIQVIGTHNSYHVEAPQDEKSVQSQLLTSVRNYWYSHAALDLQAEFQGVRNFEIDILADPEGGHYATPVIKKLNNKPFPSDPALLQPGTKVLHVPDADIETTCNTLPSCLSTVKSWSDAHPSHVPITFMIEFKTADKASVGGAQPIPWDSEALFATLEEEIKSVFPTEKLITPDDVRRGNHTLEESVLEFGWPDLESARGRVMFLMDNEGAVPEFYRKGRENLEGRVLFTNSKPGNPDCAFQKLNDPVGSENQDNIKAQVAAGYFVRTRSDVPLDTLLSDDPTAMREAAFSSGAQVVSTDFPSYGMTARWGIDYAVRFEGGVAVRCNPVNGGDCKGPLESFGSS